MNSFKNKYDMSSTVKWEPPKFVEEEEPVYTVARIESVNILGLMTIKFDQEMQSDYNISILNEQGIIEIEMVPAMDDNRA